MSVTKRHIGFGKWVVEEDGERIAGPFTGPDAKARADDFAAARVESPPPEPKTKVDGNRAYIEKMNADLRKPVDEELAEIKALLLKRRDEDETAIILRLLDPILRAGKQAGRRERMRFRFALPPAAAA